MCSENCGHCQRQKDNKKEYYNQNRDKIIKSSLEHYEKNKDDIKTKMKEYREKNKDILKEKRNEKHTCECGGRYTLYNKKTHMKSKKHIKYEERET